MLIPFRPKRERDFDPIIRKPVFNLSGLDYSLPPIEIPDQALSNCKNVYIQDGEIKSRFGYETFGRNLPLDSEIMGIHQVYDYTGTSYLFCFTTDKAYKYNTATRNWDDVTDGAGDYTGEVTEPFSVQMIYDDDAAAMKIISCNGADSDKVKYWNSTVWDDLTSYPGSGNVTNCKVLINFNHYLMMINVINNAVWFPQSIYWCDQGTPMTWTGGSSGNVHLARSSDFIIDVEFMRGQLAILKENSVTMCRYVGGTNPFEFDERRIEQRGLAAFNAKVTLGDKLVLLDSDLNVSIFDGFSMIPVTGKIQSKFIDSINPEKIKLCHMHAIDELNLILLFVPKPGSSYPNAVWIWNYKDNNWFYWELAHEVTSTGYYQTSTVLTIGELLNKIGTFNWRIGSRALYTSFPFSLIGDEDGYIYKLSENLTNDNGTAIDSKFETKSYFFGGIGQFTRGNAFDIYGKGDSVSLYASGNDGKDYEFQDTLILNKNESGLASGKRLEKTSEKMMFKLENNILDDLFSIRGWNPSAIKKGKKVKHDYLEEMTFNDGSLVQIRDVRGRLETLYTRI